MLYLGLELETVNAEFLRMASRQGRQATDFLPRRLCKYEVELGQLLDLRDAEARRLLDLSDEEFRSDDLRACQAVGEAAHYLGREGILAPSVAAEGTILAIFLERVSPESRVTVVHSEMWNAATGLPL